ncbi:MAG: metalloregulator ArsR/SmtB family transcription factor [Acidimicrobiia bacterium]|jgi:DNA-binding transcriptional ArsR family regulator
MDTLQLVAEPRRRAILGMIWKEELAAGDIASRFNVTFGAVSQHLRKLADSGLVSVRADGNRRLYRARPEAVGPLRDVLEQMWRSSLDDLAGIVEAADK